MVGDHIRALKAGRWNHAIDLGDNTVLQAVEDPALAAGDRIRRVYRPAFVEGAASVEVVTHRERTFAGKVVVARAYSRLREPALAAMFRDSEAFAAWCKAGRLPEGPRNEVMAAPAPTKGKAKAAPAKKAAKPVTKPVKKPAKAKTKPAAKTAGRKKAGRKPAARKPKAPAKKAAPGRKATAKRTAKPASRKPSRRKAARR